MLSCMETTLGLMVIGPKGQSLRLQRSNPAFLAGRDILRQALPAEQAWQKLQELMVNPLNAMISWCERFGITLKDDGTTLRLNDVSLGRACWLPLLNRTQAVGGSPTHILNFAVKLGKMAENARVADVAIHLQENKLQGHQPSLLKVVLLPREARTSDIVTTASRGDTPFLVSYQDYSVAADGEVMPQRGVVLSIVRDKSEVDDILQQPAILGFNRTYRCEEGSAEGWLEDLSFDSLTLARRNAKEIQDSGSDARIINRITGEVVAML